MTLRFFDRQQYTQPSQEGHERVTCATISGAGIENPPAPDVNGYFRKLLP
jgi:hypothetical protein